MADDWIKLYRPLLQDTIWQKSTPEQKVILISLLLMVNHGDGEWEYGGQKYKCEPGQRVTSIQGICEACGKGITTQNVRTALVRFEKLGFLTNQSTNNGRLITIKNWGKYQGKKDKPNIDTNKDLTKTSQRPNKDLTTREERKNDKNDKNDRNNTYAALPPALVVALKDFEEVRKKKRNPMTDRARELLLKKLNTMTGGDVTACIKLLEEATEKGWASVYVNPTRGEKARDSKSRLDELIESGVFKSE